MKLGSNFRLGDMSVLEMPPVDLARALAVIAEYLHAEYDAAPWIARQDKSKESCILASLAVRDFLFRAGFRDAELRACVFAIIAEKNGERLHSLGIGNPQGPDPKIKHRWDGHAVVTAGGWLIDTTLYQAVRPQWPTLPGMMAMPLAKPGLTFWDLPVLAGLEGSDGDADIAMGWLDQPTNKSWKSAPDKLRKRHWREVADRLLEHWKGYRHGL